jgi:hypothetical protein
VTVIIELEPADRPETVSGITDPEAVPALMLPADEE